jgi:hypothetical protein
MKTMANKGHHTQWAAQFMVAAELTRRNLTVSFTMGNNTPMADLMVGTSDGDQFWVDVKGLSSKNAWLLRTKQPRRNMFYILVYLAPLANKPDVRKPDRFFVLTDDEARTLVEGYKAKHPNDKGTMPGFGFNDPMDFEDAWDKLPT